MRSSKGGRPRRSRFLRLHDHGPRPLSFEDDAPRGRIGDPVPAERVRDEFPPSREREAGLTGAAVGGVTADDLAPETLLDDDPSHSPSARDDRDALDTVLREVDESEIGAGEGLDQAEEAGHRSLSRPEHARRQREAARLQEKGQRAK